MSVVHDRNIGYHPHGNANNPTQPELLEKKETRFKVLISARMYRSRDSGPGQDVEMYRDSIYEKKTALCRFALHFDRDIVHSGTLGSLVSLERPFLK
jgi:hypothetical protein